MNPEDSPTQYSSYPLWSHITRLFHQLARVQGQSEDLSEDQVKQILKSKVIQESLHQLSAQKHYGPKELCMKPANNSPAETGAFWSEYLPNPALVRCENTHCWQERLFSGPWGHQLSLSSFIRGYPTPLSMAHGPISVQARAVHTWKNKDKKVYFRIMHM